MSHAEALFLVDYQKPEILELNIGGEKSVRTDDDIDIASFQRAERCLLLFDVLKRDSSDIFMGKALILEIAV